MYIYYTFDQNTANGSCFYTQNTPLGYGIVNIFMIIIGLLLS